GAKLSRMPRVPGPRCPPILRGAFFTALQQDLGPEFFLRWQVRFTSLALSSPRLTKRGNATSPIGLRHLRPARHCLDRQCRTPRRGVDAGPPPPPADLRYSPHPP